MDNIKTIGYQPRYYYDGLNNGWEVAVVMPDVDDLTFETYQDARENGVHWCYENEKDDSKLRVVKLIEEFVG